MDSFVAALGGLMSLMFLYGLLSWFACGAFSSHVASEKGRCGVCWFFWGILFGPMALLAVVGLPDIKVSQTIGTVNGSTEPTRQAENLGKQFGYKAKNPGMWVALILLFAILYYGFKANAV